MSNYLSKSIIELHDMLVKKEITPVDLVNEVFDKIESDKLNCFITTDKFSALERAKSLVVFSISINFFDFQVGICPFRYLPL